VSTEQKVALLKSKLEELGSVLVAFSGGVDSTFVLAVAASVLGDKAVALTATSASLPEEELFEAQQLAKSFGVRHVAVSSNELHDPRYAANPTNRCYFCKTELWARLGAVARERGMAVVCDGTNADDLSPGEHRPGFAAGVRAGVRSPLAEAGLDKAAIRASALDFGLPNWNAPAAPCLSSRVQYGLQITPDRLRQVEASEAYLRELGVTGDLRVRHRGAVAWIEVEPAWLARIEPRLLEIRGRFAALGFAGVELDPHGYRRGGLLADRATAAP